NRPNLRYVGSDMNDIRFKLGDTSFLPGSWGPGPSGARAEWGTPSVLGGNGTTSPEGGFGGLIPDIDFSTLLREAYSQIILAVWFSVHSPRYKSTTSKSSGLP